MATTTVLVTGAGGGVGQSVIKSLQHRGIRIVGADGEPHATGLYAADRGYLVPYAGSAGFVDALLAICEHEGCRALFPGLDAELPPLSMSVNRFRAIGCDAIVSSPDVVRIADDKLATARFLQQQGLEAPWTVPFRPDAVDDLSLPVVLKPRLGGARSRGVYVVRSRGELEHQVVALSGQEYVVQEYLDGDEYTCGSVTVGGACRGVIIMRRVLREGDTYKAFVVRHEATEQYVTRVVTALSPFGACNVQLRLRNGRPCAFEINARCSGTTFCRSLAGFNEPMAVLEFLRDGRIPSFNIGEIAIFRYWRELVVQPERIATLGLQGMIDGNSTRL